MHRSSAPECSGDSAPVRRILRSCRSFRARSRSHGPTGFPSRGYIGANKYQPLPAYTESAPRAIRVWCTSASQATSRVGWAISTPSTGPRFRTTIRTLPLHVCGSFGRKSLHPSTFRSRKSRETPHCAKLVKLLSSANTAASLASRPQPISDACQTGGSSPPQTTGRSRRAVGEGAGIATHRFTELPTNRASLTS